MMNSDAGLASHVSCCLFMTLVRNEHSVSGSITPLLEPEDEGATTFYETSGKPHPATLRHVPGELSFQRRRPVFKIQHLISKRHGVQHCL